MVNINKKNIGFRFLLVATIFWCGKSVGMWRIKPYSSQAIKIDGKGSYGVSIYTYGGLMAGSSVFVIWDLKKQEPIKRFREGEGYDFNNYIDSMALDDAGTYAITGGDKGEIIIWDVKNQKILRVFDKNSTGYSGKNRITFVAISGNGSYALLGAIDGSVALWDIANQKRISKIDKINKKISDDYPTSIALSKTGDVALLGTDKGYGVIVDIKNLGTKNVELMPKLFQLTDKQRIESLALTADGNYGVYAAQKKGFVIIDLKKDEIDFFNEKNGGHTYPVELVAMDKNGNYAISASNRNGDRADTVKIWDVKNQKLLATFDKNNVKNFDKDCDGLAGATTALAMSANGDVAIVCSEKDDKVIILDIKKQALLKCLPVKGGAWNSAAVSANGQVFVYSTVEDGMKFYKNIPKVESSFSSFADQYLKDINLIYLSEDYEKKKRKVDEIYSMEDKEKQQEDLNKLKIMKEKDEELARIVADYQKKKQEEAYKIFLKTAEKMTKEQLLALQTALPKMLQKMKEEKLNEEQWVLIEKEIEFVKERLKKLEEKVEQKKE